MSFSIVILTLNEEINLPACLQSAAFCDDIVVIDSFSSDRTIDISKSMGARFIQRKFDNFAGQRNYAIDDIKFKHPWVFHLDADERFTEALKEECEQAIKEDQFSGLYVPGKMIFQGKWLKHAGTYPAYQMRLMKVGEVRFVQKGHGQRESESKRGLGYLNEPLQHFNFSKGFVDWFDKHNLYARQEAVEWLKDMEQTDIDWAGIFSLNSLHRRRSLKDLSFRLPGRILLKFIYMYFLRLGFIDGLPGLNYCVLNAIVQYMITLNIEEIRRQQKGLPA